MRTINGRLVAGAWRGWDRRAGRCGASLARFVLAMFTFSLSACASVATTPPDARGAPSSVATSTVQGSAGAKSPQASKAVLSEVSAEGNHRQFRQHLAILERLGETLFAGNDATLLVDGPETFDAMLEAIDGAKERILVESYIFDDEGIGERIAEAMLRKRAAGLEVRLIYDSVGSFETPVEFFDRLREGGVAVCEFNPVSPLRRATGFLDFNNRDHRKVLVVDDRIAFTGGINVSRVYSSGGSGSGSQPADDADGAPWRDTHVRVAGPAVREFLILYEDTWRRQECDDQLPPLIADVPPKVTDSGVASPPEQGERLVAVIGSVADGEASPLHRALLAAIDGATDSIHITMAYFVPDDQTLRALAAAAQRGVEVKLVLPGRSDSTLVLRAGQAHYGELLAAGARIFERHDTILHAKTAVIDGVWTTIGSSNLDLRSMLHNDELNVIILGREFGAKIERLFEEDMKDAVEVTPEAWAARGVGRRLMETFGRLWEYWL